MSDKGSTSVESMLGTGDWTDQLGSEENEEQPKELDQPETQPCADEPLNTSVHLTEKVGQQIGKDPEKIEVKTEVTPMNLKVQRKSVTKIVKQQQTLTESGEKQSRLPDQRSFNVLDLNVKEKEADTQPQDQWNDGKPAVKKAKISHQKARALANMIPYYCCLVCDPTPVKSPDKLEATAFTQYTALTQHLRDKHNIRSRFEKLFTIKKFPNVKTNTQEKYQCQYCPIYYHMPGFLVKHLRDQHGVKDQIVKGSAHFEVVKPEVMEYMGSGREVKTEDGASDVHPSSSHGRTVTQYCCALCPESNDKTMNAFLQFKSLEDHLMTCHKVTSGFDTYCTSQQVPVLEVSKHDVVTYGKHRCKLCSAQYNYMGFMARHLSEKHELKDLDMKWSDYVEVVTPEMESCSQDSVLKDQSCKLLGKDTTKAESERQLVQEQHSRSSVAKPTSNPSKKPSFSVNLSPSSSALDLSLRKKSLSQEQLTSAQSGHIIYQCTLCKSFFRFYTNATDHLGTKHSKYGAACAKHIKEMSAKIVEFRRHREQENSSSANQEVNEGSPSLTKKTTVSDQDIAQMSSLPPESLVGLSNEGDNTDFSTLDISLIDAEGVIYECLTCKAVFPKWALLIRHYECCTWDSSSHLHAMVRMPREVVESFFATSPSGSECSFCYSTIKDQTMLASHLQTHTQPRVLLTCEGDEDRKDSDCPIATSAAKIAQYTGTPLSQPETTVSHEETSANKDLNEN
ncbi:transcription corepressor [Branchiostoma belcheri]|nr:transcription corepressor [Branchiostoma belcheri]